MIKTNFKGTLNNKKAKQRKKNQNGEEMSVSKLIYYFIKRDIINILGEKCK